MLKSTCLESDCISDRTEYQKDNEMTKGFCCGTFDPITIGHVDIIERASKLCSKIVVGVVVNYAKASYFTLEERTEMVKAALAHLKNVEVVCFSEHLPTYVINHGFDVIIRGLRNESDFDYEIGLAQLYDHFFKGCCETVYIMTKPEYSYISSTIVRQNFQLGADISGWVTPPVYKLMEQYKNG